MNRIVALVPASGVGQRMGATYPKQYLPLKGKPILWHSLNTLCSNEQIAHVYVIISASDGWFETFDWSNLPYLSVFRLGGDSRAQTVLNGLQALSSTLEADDWVIVHDAVRPCLSQNTLDRFISFLKDDPIGGLLALPISDTVKRATPEGTVQETVSRVGLWAAQTPQMFRYARLKKALESAHLALITDESSALEQLGEAPHLVEGDPSNIKITYPQDLELLEQRGWNGGF